MTVVIGGGGQGVSFYQMQGNSWKNHRLTGFFFESGFFFRRLSGDVMLFYHFILFWGMGACLFFFLGMSLFIQYNVHCFDNKIGSLYKKKFNHFFHCFV